MIKIKITLPGAAKHINLSQFLGNKYNTYKNCNFFVNEEVSIPDFWFLFEGPDSDDFKCDVNPERIYFVTAEVALPAGHYDNFFGEKFLKQFGKIYTCHDIYKDNVISTLPFLPWMINANHGHTIFEEHERDFNYFSTLSRLEKTGVLSVFCSSVTWTENHKQRLRFVGKLKEHFKDKLDWYGNGVNSLERKWDGIAPYKYHLTLENQSTCNVITEKLYDAFLGLSYPLYWGAPNVKEFFPEDSLTTININDLNGTIRTIESVIEGGFYELHRNSILEAKDLCLSKYNVFHRIGEICIQDYKEGDNSLVRNIEIEKMGIAPKRNVTEKVLNFSGRAFQKIGRDLVKLSQKK